MAETRFAVLVFDWDGTLSDSTGLIAEAILRAAGDVGIPVPDRSQAWQVIGLGMAQALAQVVPDLPREQIPAFVARYQLHFHQGEESIRLFAGVRETLDVLRSRGVPMAVATGKSRAGLARALERAGLDRHFQALRCADQTIPKPHPAMLLELAEEFGVEPARLLMVGDTSHDLQMAASAGAASLGACFGAHPRAQLEAHEPLALFDTPGELHEWLLAHFVAEP